LNLTGVDIVKLDNRLDSKTMEKFEKEKTVIPPFDIGLPSLQVRSKGKYDIFEQEKKKGFYACKAKPKKKYMYTATYVPSDLPLIAGDAVGTAGAAVVPLIPIGVAVGAAVGISAYKHHQKYHKTRARKYRQEIEPETTLISNEPVPVEAQTYKQRVQSYFGVN